MTTISSSLTKIVICSIVGVVVLGTLGYFVTPTYKEAVTTALETLKELLLFALGVKGGIAAPQMFSMLPQAPDQKTKSESLTDPPKQ